MAITDIWQNADGLEVRSGVEQGVKINKMRSVLTDGAIKQMVLNIDFTKGTTTVAWFPSDLNNDGTSDGFTTADPYLPANSSVLRATLIATEAAVGGTSFTIGTYTQAGAAIAATGLFTATEGVIANINTVGLRTYGAGALVAAAVGTAGVGTADAYVTFVPTGTYTAGKAKLVIEYIDALVDA